MSKYLRGLIYGVGLYKLGAPLVSLGQTYYNVNMRTSYAEQPFDE